MLMAIITMMKAHGDMKKKPKTEPIAARETMSSRFCSHMRAQKSHSKPQATAAAYTTYSFRDGQASHSSISGPHAYNRVNKTRKTYFNLFTGIRNSDLASNCWRLKKTCLAGLRLFP